METLMDELGMAVIYLLIGAGYVGVLGLFIAAMTYFVG